MLYGGPLGTYLSRLSTTSNSTTAITTTKPYSSTGLTRSNSQYRGVHGASPTSSASLTSGVGASNYLSSYYTPQLRRKYGSTESDVPKTSRFIRTNLRKSPSAVGYSYTSSPSASYTGLSSYVRRSSSRSPSLLDNTSNGVGTSSSWNSDLNTVTTGAIDYKELYESEKAITDGLREEIFLAEQDLQELKGQMSQEKESSRRSSDAETRKLERKISECKEELKSIDRLKLEQERLRAEHRALARVVSRLHKDK